MDTLQKAFFELVRAGLWGTAADARAFDAGTDWTQLYKYGQTQTLLGIMLDGMQTLPDELRPQRGLYLQWCASVLHTEENNRRLNSEIGRLYALLRENGIEPVLLKGQGAARNYPNPLHRQCGDIDIYIGERNFEQVNRLLGQEGSEEAEATAHHCSFKWHGVDVENHRILARMHAPLANRRLQRNIASWHGTDRMVRFDLDGCEVTVPPVEFDALFLLQHSVHHLLAGGVGLRQICDWACLLHRNSGTIDRREVADSLRALHLDKVARVFGALAVKYLGLAEDELPVPLHKGDFEAGDRLMDDIWQSGNFGRGDSGRKPRPQGYWRGKWYTFTTAVGRNFKLWRVAPAEALWTPAVMITNVIKAQLYMRTNRRKAE